MKTKIIPDPYGHNITSNFDARLRYNDTIIRYKGVPTLLSIPREDYTAILFQWGGRDIIEVGQKDIRKFDFDTNFVGLGWCKGPQETPAYLQRTPTRGSKQGLNKNNVVYSQCTNVRKNSLFRSTESILKYLQQGYLNTEEIDLHKVEAVALSPEICMVYQNKGNFKIYFHTDIVGYFNRDTRETIINNPEITSIIEYTLRDIGL